MGKYLFFVVLVLWWSSYTANAETRDEIRQEEIKTELKDKFHIYDVKTKVEDRSSLGYRKYLKNEHDSRYGLNYIVSVMLDQTVPAHILVLKLQCVDNKNNFPINARYRKVSWEIVNKDQLKIGRSKGEATTNEKGELPLLFDAKEDVGSAEFKFTINGYSKSLVAERGPYELFFPIEACGKVK